MVGAGVGTYHPPRRGGGAAPQGAGLLLRGGTSPEAAAGPGPAS